MFSTPAVNTSSVFKYDSNTQTSFRNPSINTLQGNAGGLTIIGGTGSGDDLTLKSTSDATQGTIFEESPIQMFSSAISVENLLAIQVGANGITLTGAGTAGIGILTAGGTVTISGAVPGTGLGVLFNHAFNYVNSGAINFVASYGYLDQPTFTADTSSRTLVTHRGYFTQWSYAISNAGALAVTTRDDFLSLGFSIGAGTTLTTWNGFHASDVFIKSGTLTTHVGVKIDNFTNATNNWSIQAGTAQSYHAGRFRIGSTVAPTAKVHCAAGASGASTAPLKIDTGTAMATAEDGAIEYHTSHLYFTIGTERFQLDQQYPGALGHARI